MPINLDYEALEAKEKYEAATTLNEKIRTLQDYISLIPKHKGTEKLLYNLKRRLVKLTDEKEKKKNIGKSTGGNSEYNIKKEGAGQAVMVGFTNAGKSTLFNSLVNLERAKVDSYEFTTTTPEVGMILFEDVQIQLVELPPIYEGSSQNREQFNTIRNCDLVLIVIDLSKDPNDQMNVLLNEMKKVNIKVNYQKKDIVVEKTGIGGIVIINKGIRIDNEREDIVELLQSNGIHNARVVINEPIETIKEMKKAILESIKTNIEYKDAIIIATKGEIKGSEKSFKILTNIFGDRFPIVPVSSKKEIGINDLKEIIFKELKVIRVYTRESNRKVSKRPIIVDIGGTIEDVAKKLSSNFLNEFKYAHLYRTLEKGNKNIARRRVGINYELIDKDISQIFT